MKTCEICNAGHDREGQRTCGKAWCQHQLLGDEKRKRARKQTAGLVYKVSFIQYTSRDGMQPTEMVARFRSEGEAIAYAILAHKQFPSPHPGGIRRYIVEKRRNRIYTAG